MSNKTPRAQALATGLSIAGDLVLPILGGGYVGRYLDERMHWHPWGTFVGVLAGFALGGYLAYRVIRRALDRLP